MTSVEEQVDSIEVLADDTLWAYLDYGTDGQPPRVFGPYETEGEARDCRFVEPLAKGTDGYVLPMIEPYQEEGSE